MASPRDFRSQEPTRTLPERVGQLYYSHGLFCSSHPVPVIVFAITVVLLCCYPLLNLPMPGNVPQQLLGNLTVQGSNVSDKTSPQWFVGPPMVYIQQVIVKTAVCPWTKDMMLTDAFRAPLSEVFKLLEVIQNYQHENSYQNLQKGKISLAEMLFGMNMKDTGIKRYPLRTRQRVLQFAVTIVFKEYDIQFLAGLQQKLTKSFPLHQPVNMMSHLSIDSNETTTPPIPSGVQEVLHIYYPGEFNISELVPLTVTYFMLFIYVYFSVCKIELVKSKVGMAFSAVMTALASLFMSVGLCFFFGLTLSLNGRDVFPYLVVIVGLENVLVLTKSVVSTPTHLDVKIRIAQGLSREGWSITKNLLTEVTILTVGLFTFVPAIQKFCIFAVVGLISDFFLQMFFFSTVLAIDIRRMELSSEPHHHRIQYPVPPGAPAQQTLVWNLRSSQTSGPAYKTLARSKSHPRLNGMNVGSSSPSNYPTNVVAPPHGSDPSLVKVPKRLRVVHFWARTRIFQRTFMLFMVVWIIFIVYSSGVVEQLLQVNPDPVVSEKVTSVAGSEAPLAFQKKNESLFKDSGKEINHSDVGQTIIFEKTSLNPFVSLDDTENSIKNSKLGASEKSNKNDLNDTSLDDYARLKHSGFDPWRRLSHHHWPAILSLYNISVAGQYISILPSIRLSLAVTPDIARSVRNLEEHTVQHFQWQALAAALDPLDFSDGESSKIPSQKTFLGSDVPFIPTSPMEIFFTAVLCIISVVVLAYTMVVLYRCVCSRNYAEWRTSWAGENEDTRDGITQVVKEAVPLVLDGHQQEVECLSTDGAVVVSSCLGGHLYFSMLQRPSLSQSEVKMEELSFSDYESGSPPSHGEASLEEAAHRNQQFWDFPDLQPSINTNFTTRPHHVEQENYQKSDDHLRKRGFFYGSKYEDIYREYRHPSESYKTRDEKKFDYSNQGEGVKSDTHHKGFLRSRSSVPVLGQEKREETFASALDPISVSYQNVHSGCKTEDGPEIEALNCECDQLLNTNEEHTCSHINDSSQCCNCSYPQKGKLLQRHSSEKEIRRLSELGKDSENLWTSNEVVNSHSIRLKNQSSGSLGGNSHGEVNKRLQHGVPVSVPYSAVGTDSNIVLSDVQSVPPIWCLDCHENLIAIGCASGRIEFWEGSTGKLKCLFEDGTGIGITAVKIIGNRVVAAKLSGAVDFFELESFSQGQPTDWGFTYRRTHVRTNSAGALSDWNSWAAQHGVEQDIRCIHLNTTRAHQQPITVLDSEGGRVLTGSQDHTLKVFRLEDQLPLYTLHGHSGPVSCLFIDRISPMMSGSGSQDGLLCVWDLLTGACMYSIQAHDGSVVALTYSASYVISLGTDERLCVWERFQGHLLNTIQVAHTYCSSMVMLTHNLLITSKQGSLVVWDVRTGVPVRVVKLGHSDKCVFVKQILLLRDSVVCDYSNQLRIVRFPLVTDKCE
ncbi:F-box/WD repeat-containing protein 7 [Gryllus bimaculatus]|nr:F-box/WD repeat-containing protein 7 [Gryllus bimaculatus]